MRSGAEVIQSDCICARECDCQQPEPVNGLAMISEQCPIHNTWPKPDYECGADVHWDERTEWHWGIA